MAEVELEQRRFRLDGVENDEGVVHELRIVEVCIVTNSTLERSFSLPLLVDRKNGECIILWPCMHKQT